MANQGSGVGGDRLLTTKEVAERLGVERETVQVWCVNRTLPAVKLPREWRIRESALVAWLDEREKGTRNANR